MGALQEGRSRQYTTGLIGHVESGSRSGSGYRAEMDGRDRMC